MCSPPDQQIIHPWQLQVGVTSLPCLQHIGDVLSHLELGFARHRAPWLRSNKALRHELIINRITQVFELSTCSAALLGSPRDTVFGAHGTELTPCVLPGLSVHEGAWDSPSRALYKKGHGCKCHQSEFFCCLHLGLVVRLSPESDTAAARPADAAASWAECCPQSGCQHHTPATSLELISSFLPARRTQSL